MGIHGLLGQIGHGERISLVKLSSQYYVANSRPFRIAIDISIWLFQIQSGKGGSNPALRTFYYRLLRLLSLNIHPLFVFDGPNKPLFKRNKKVGGPGVRVASVPEFLAKQLLKQFGFPWHVAPGEAEAECALLQREGIVDAVLSEDVDTLMFGSGVTIRNWTAENSTKTPTHVDVHRADRTKARSGMDREGMILVALMSGGDYLPEGIPGCGPKVACDAARAGFGSELCQLAKKDKAGLKAWKERLLHEIRTNESKYFRRKNAGLAIPEDFPNREVLGFYTHPCVSTPEKLERLRQELRWDLSIDFQALRSFTADAFDWRCIGGAKKFIKNLAPALLMRQLRLRGKNEEQLDQEIQEEQEGELIHAIHGKRNHSTADGELEYRISFTPTSFVPIDLNLEDEDDEFVPAGWAELAEDSAAESELISSTQNAGCDDSEAPASPSKKRYLRPYYPDQPEKLWILKPFLQIGCPLLVEDYEASFMDPKEFLKARRKARAAEKSGANVHAAPGKSKKGKKTKEVVDMPQNALMAYAQITKAKDSNVRTMKELSPEANSRSNSQSQQHREEREPTAAAGFQLPSTQIPQALVQGHRSDPPLSQPVETLDLAASSPQKPIGKNTAVRAQKTARPFAAFSAPGGRPKRTEAAHGYDKDRVQSTPRKNSKKRPSPDLSSPAMSQRTITSFYSPSPRKPATYLKSDVMEEEVIVDLVSSSPESVQISRFNSDRQERPLTPTPPNTRFHFVRRSESPINAQSDFSPGKLPNSVTKRRKKSPLKRSQTEPALGQGDQVVLPLLISPSKAAASLRDEVETGLAEVVDLIASSPTKSDGGLPSPSNFVQASQAQLTFRIDAGRGNADGTAQQKSKSVALGEPLLDEPLLSGAQTPNVNHTFAAEADMFSRVRHPVQILDEPPQTLCPTPSSCLNETEDLPPLLEPTTTIVSAKPPTKAKKSASTSSTERQSRQLPRQHSPKAVSISQALRRSPRQQLRKRIQLRGSLEGAWSEVNAEMLDITGDGSGWKKSGGKAKLPEGWRKSGVEVLDLTGA